MDMHLLSRHLLQLKASWFAFLWIIEGRSIIRRRNILGFIVRGISGSHSNTQLYKRYTVRMDFSGSNRWFFKQSAESVVFSRNYKQRTDTRSVEPLLILGRTVSITWLVTLVETQCEQHFLNNVVPGQGLFVVRLPIKKHNQGNR